MKNDNFLEVARALSSALIDDFRGFLSEGLYRVDVPEDVYHLQVAYKEMLNVSGWAYESGTGQNPIVDYMKFKKSIYLTRIKKDNSSDYQRTVGYLTNVYSDVVEYKGKKMVAYEVLRLIAIGMGYDVDEYTLPEKINQSNKNQVSITTFKGQIKVSKRNNMDVMPHRTLSPGDKPVFSNGLLIGFLSNGKFVNVRNYRRYVDLIGDENNSSTFRRNKL